MRFMHKIAVFRPERTAEASDLRFRRNVRQKIVAGDAEGTQAMLRHMFPHLGGGPSASEADLDLHFHLSCQRFVELIRQGAIEKAVAFAQKVLSSAMRFWLVPSCLHIIYCIPSR